MPVLGKQPDPPFYTCPVIYIFVLFAKISLILCRWNVTLEIEKTCFPPFM